jgi:hypothetical protein
MKLGNHMRKEKKDKEKEKEKERDREGKEVDKEAAEHLEEVVKDQAKEGDDTGREDKDNQAGKQGKGVPQEKGEKSNSLLAPAQTDEADSSESTEISRAGSPAPTSQNGSQAALGHVPSLHRHQHNAGGKGWSTMLDGECAHGLVLIYQTGCVAR